MEILKTSQIEQKITDYRNHCIKALSFYEQKNYSNCTQELRKSCEAMFKILLFSHFGDKDGLKLVLGKLDFNRRALNGKDLMFQQLFDNAKKTSKYNSRYNGAFEDIQKHGNDGSHNPNKHEQLVNKIDADLCKGQSYKLTKWLYTELLGLTIPKEILSAYDSNIISNPIYLNNEDEWSNFYNAVDEFNSRNKYILVVPPRFEICSKEELYALTKINWSFILDFNPNTKKNGLYSVFEKDFSDKIIPISIEQKEQSNIVGEGRFRINWLFSNGLQSLPETITDNIKSWRKKYHKFIEKLFSEYFSKSTQRNTIIYLYDNIEYLEEIVQIVADLNDETNDLIEHVFISQNNDVFLKVNEFDKYDINSNSINTSISKLLSGINATNNVEYSSDKKSIIVPARTVEDNNTQVEISSIYSTLLDNHIEVVHFHIATLALNEIEQVPAFFKGQKISWKEISNDIDISRNKTKNITDKIKNILSNAKNSVKFELRHQPGAGGTTISRRIAFDIRKDYPTIIISKYIRNKTNKLIYDIIENTQKPILAVVEASSVNSNELEEIIRQCNSEKKIVVFLYIIRSYSNSKETEKTSMLKASMCDVAEKDRFIVKFMNFSAKKDDFNIFKTKKPNECELIDFSLTLDIQDYNNMRLKEYVQAYIDKCSEKHVEFIKYVAIIYHYTQKSVSELIFRSLFKKSLSDELKQIAKDNQHIRRVLIQEVDLNGEESEYWRPRYQKFSELILKVIIGENWKDNLSQHVIGLIKCCKTNNNYLNDEVQQILKSLIFERNNVDLLGTDEEYKGAKSNDQFSLILKDILEKQKQKDVLLTLVECYPNESHFLGHFGRFLYEKADEFPDYEEAENYIDQSFESGGESDSNLQHIAGMCQRRKIEFYKRNFQAIKKDKDSLKLEVMEMTELANNYFNSSRKIDPFNIHAYVAQIQTLIQVVDFGRELSGIEKKENFLSSPSYKWFAEQFTLIITLIDEAKIVLENLESNGKSITITKGKNYIRLSEANSYELLGDYSSSISVFKNLSDTADRNLRPYFRSMYIYSVLLKRVKGHKNEIDKAWCLLSKEEEANIDAALNDNLLQDPSNIQSMRLWLKLVRYSKKSISIPDIISRLKIWYENNTDNPIASLECAYYLYIFHSCLAIKSGDSFSDYNITESKRYVSICNSETNNSKFPYEWLGKGENIDMLINHKNKEYDDFSSLMLVDGVITNIYSRQQGKIKLECGLEAFFVPYHGDFLESRDATLEVSFYVGFRHDGLIAWNVRRKNEISKEIVEIYEDYNLRNEFDEIFKIEEIEEIEIEELADKQTTIETFKTEVPRIDGPKIVGHIDLSQFDKGKKKR